MTNKLAHPDHAARFFEYAFDLDRPGFFAAEKVRDYANEMFAGMPGKPAPALVTGDQKKGLRLYAADAEAAETAIETLALRFDTRIDLSSPVPLPR